MQEIRKKAITMLLGTIPHEDVNREGLLNTPDRIAKMYDEIFSGYGKSEGSIFKSTFQSDNEEMVIVKDIDYYSHCEHHMVPFFGKVHVGYIPDKKVLGLSKFGRLVEIYARRLQIQEQLTYQIAEAIQTHLNPLGVIVVVEGVHMCMVMRGVKKANSKTITSAVRGAFKNNLDTRQEFFNLID